MDGTANDVAFPGITREIVNNYPTVAFIPASPLETEALIFSFQRDVDGDYLRNDFLRFVERHATLAPIKRQRDGGSLRRPTMKRGPPASPQSM